MPATCLPRMGAEAASRWLAALRSGRLALPARRRALLAVALFSAGALAGLAAGRLTAAAPGHPEGACIALRTAAALGYLDDGQRRMVTHVLATAVNPDVDLFPGGPRAIQHACE